MLPQSSSGSRYRVAVAMALAIVVGHIALLAIFPAHPLTGIAYHLVSIGAAFVFSAVAALRASGFGRRFWTLMAAGFSIAWIAAGTRLWFQAYHPGYLSLTENFLFLVHMLPFALALLLHDREGEGALAALPNLFDYLQLTLVAMMLFAAFVWLPYRSATPSQIRAADLACAAVFVSRNALITAGALVRVAISKTRRERLAYGLLSTYLLVYSVGSLIGQYLYNNYQPAPRWIELEGTIPFAAALILSSMWREFPNESRTFATTGERRSLAVHAIPATLPFSVGVFAFAVGRIYSELAWVAVTTSFALFGFRLLATIYAEHRAEERRAAAESSYRSLFEGNLAGVFLCTDRGQFLDCNQAFLEMFGFAGRRDLAERDLREVVFPAKDRDESLRKLTDQLALRNFEALLRRSDGSELWVLQNLTLRRDGAATLIEGTVIDITERRRSAIEVSNWRNRYEAAVEASGMAIYEWVPESGSATFGGDVLKLAGYSAEELNSLRPNWYELVVEADKEHYLRQLKEALASGKLLDFEYRISHRNGNIRNIREQGRAIFGNDGRVSRVVGVVADITERRMLEEHLLRAQKMEAVGRLSAGIAHDFNNMLTVIRGYTELLRDRLHDQPPMLHPVLEIENSAAQAANLTRQLLAFSRQQALEPRIVDLNQILRNMDSVLHRLCGHDIDVKLQLDNLIGNTRIDPAQLQQIVLNLVSNARDAMPKGGTIIIETRNTELAVPEVGTGLEITPGQYVMLAVHDTGIGMDAETKTHIFEPFFTTKEFGKGTGLGLASLYGVVRQSGGHVWVYSELGKGSSFKLYFPRIGGRSDILPSVRIKPHSFHGTETIALAEDEASLRELASSILSRCGYSVVHVHSLDDLDKLSTTVNVDLLLTDIVMPAGSGREFGERCQQLWPRAHVLYMSGYPEAILVHEKSLQPGSNFLQKPFTPSALAQKIREILDAGKRATSASA